MVGSGTRNARAISSVVRPPSRPEREGHPRLEGEHGVTCDEHQAQEVIADLVVGPGVEVGLGQLLLDLELPRELLLLALEPRPAAQQVDRAMLSRCP